MIELPKIKRDPKETEDLCNVKSEQDDTFQFSLIDVGQCVKVAGGYGRAHFKNHQKNSFLKENLLTCATEDGQRPCPLFGRTKGVTIQERNAPHKPHVVRICQAPVDDTADTPYLRCAELARALGAWGAVKACCAFCECGACCPCGIRDYLLHDAERKARRRSDMREFDARVKTDHQIMRIMYDKE